MQRHLRRMPKSGNADYVWIEGRDAYELVIEQEPPPSACLVCQSVNMNEVSHSVVKYIYGRSKLRDRPKNHVHRKHRALYKHQCITPQVSTATEGTIIHFENEMKNNTSVTFAWQRRSIRHAASSIAANIPTQRSSVAIFNVQCGEKETDSIKCINYPSSTVMVTHSPGASQVHCRCGHAHG